MYKTVNREHGAVYIYLDACMVNEEARHPRRR
jgi:hypothetical protein